MVELVVFVLVLLALRSILSNYPLTVPGNFQLIGSNVTYFALMLGRPG